MKNIAVIFAAVLLSASVTLCASDSTNSADTAAAPANNAGQGQARAKLRQKLLAMFDANHDGKLEGDELEKAKAWLKEKRAEFAQKHPEQAKKMAEMRQKMQAQHGQNGQNAAGAQKTVADSSTPAPTPAESQAIQKAVDNFTAEPPVKL